MTSRIGGAARSCMRVYSMHAVQVCAALGLIGCGAGRYPSALSQRPLSMPGGEHQLILGGGLTRDGGHKVVPAADLGYRVGFTDNVGFALPLIISYGGPVADNLELKGAAGLWGFGSGGTQISKHYRDDPRYTLNGTENLYSILVAALSGRSMIDSGSALRFGVETRAIIGGRVYLPALGGHAALVFELGPLVSMGLGASLWLNSELPNHVEDRQVALLQIGSAGSEFTPLVAYHLADELDLYGTFLWAFNISDGIGAYFGTAGIDWHFD